jgi:Fe-S-cluster containining protein
MGTSVVLPLCTDCFDEADRVPEFRTLVEVALMMNLGWETDEDQPVPPVEESPVAFDEEGVTLSTELPVLPADDPCRGCGACCLHLVWPPFFRIEDREWMRLGRERPELVAEIEIDRIRRRQFGLGGEYVAPCHWYDLATRRCRHYEYRPAVCRDFEPGEEDCRCFRAEHGID